MKLNDTELKVLIYIIQNEHEGIYGVDFKSIYSSMNKCKSRVRQIVLKTTAHGLHTVLEACGASVMLMKGVSELDWKFYSSKIEGFEYDDLVNMPAYHSINLVYTHTGKFYSFLTQLPKPV